MTVKTRRKTTVADDAATHQGMQRLRRALPQAITAEGEVVAALAEIEQVHPSEQAREWMTRTEKQIATWKELHERLDEKLGAAR